MGWMSICRAHMKMIVDDDGENLALLGKSLMKEDEIEESQHGSMGIPIEQKEKEMQAEETKRELQIEKVDMGQ